MRNSALVTDYVPASATNYTVGRGENTISKITIHHMAGKATAAQCGAIFAAPGRQASANYGVGYDGSVGLYVDEANRSWASSSTANDNVAVTIEVSNDGGADTDWHVSDTALNKTIELCADICKRNEIARLNFTGNSSGNLTQHCYFASTQCPGAYLKSKFPYIAEQVNKTLEVEDMTREETAELIRHELNQQYEYVAKIVWTEAGAMIDRALAGEEVVPDWAKADFDAAVKAGITTGASPCALIPRYQAAIMAYRAAKK
jgi:hypothetical protein